MDNRFKHRLGSADNQVAVNVDGYKKIALNQTNNNLPVGELNRIVNVADRFDLERQSSKIYRLNGTISTLFTNPLMNVTGTNSFASFMTNPLFRDRSYPSNSVNYGEAEDLTYAEAIDFHLKEVDGWFGFYDPDQTQASLCLFNDMEPNRSLFDLTPKNKIKNWELTVTYPASSATTNMTTGGLIIIGKQNVTVSNRPMVAFATPVRHDLSQGDTVRLTGLVNATDSVYPVIQTGLQDGSLSEYYFVIDLDHTTTYGTNTRMSKMLSDEPSVYYYRKFKKVATIKTDEIEQDDYEMYPLNFSRSLFNDKVDQFMINEDIDISGLLDNLGRPLSELYITLLKTDSNQLDGIGSRFTTIKSGIELPFISGTSQFVGTVPDIKRIHNGTTPTSHTPLESGINIASSDFYGDVVSYNRLDVKETILAEVMHRFNTPNRDAGGSVTDTLEGTVNLGSRYEGQYYQPHHRIPIREYSNYVEQGDSTTEGIPDYAEDLTDGRFLWRDLLDIGFSDTNAEPVTYPFLNGSHYIHRNITLALRRQDQFDEYGLYYGTFPADPSGKTMTDNFEVNESGNAC